MFLIFLIIKLILIDKYIKFIIQHIIKNIDYHIPCNYSSVFSKNFFFKLHIIITPFILADEGFICNKVFMKLLVIWNIKII